MLVDPGVTRRNPVPLTAWFDNVNGAVPALEMTIDISFFAPASI